MPKKAEELKPVQLRGLDPGRHAVGGDPGLLLQVQTRDGRDQPNSGRSSWVLQYMIAGRRRQLGLGPYPEVTLADAREKARQVRQGIRDGIDPLAAKAVARSAIQAAVARAVTFQTAAEDRIAAHQAEWRNAKSGKAWTATLKTYAFPVLGKMLVADIDQAAVLRVLQPIWTTKTVTATRVRERIETILDYATTKGMREGPNPARWKGHLDHILAAPKKIAKVVHHAALAIDDLHAFMQRLRAAEGQGARALEFAILTAARSGEVRGATWAEIDIDACQWVIPKERMKMEREHRVPLSAATIELLQAQGPGEPDELLFPGMRGKPLSDMSLTAVLRRMKLDVTAHGFRSTFRDWAGERTATPREVVELALAHQIASKAEAAYARSDLLERRRPLMQAWAEFIDAAPATNKVVSIGKKKTA